MLCDRLKHDRLCLVEHSKAVAFCPLIQLEPKKSQLLMNASTTQSHSQVTWFCFANPTYSDEREA